MRIPGEHVLAYVIAALERGLACRETAIGTAGVRPRVNIDRPGDAPGRVTVEP